MKVAETKTKSTQTAVRKQHKIEYTVYNQLVCWLECVTYKNRALKPLRDEDQTCKEPPHPSNQP